MERRDFLARCIATGIAGSPLLQPIRAAAAAPAELGVTPLAERLTLLSGAGGNVVLFNSPDGVLLVDGGAPEHSAALLAKVRTLTGTDRVHTLFNTHWHWDQTGSNLALGARGTRILAHENTRLWLGTDVDCTWRHRVFKRMPAQARPTQTFYTTGTLTFGGEQIDYGYLPQAHTDSDIYVRFRNANVIACGDVLSVAAYPIIDYTTGGWIGGLGDATRTLVELGNATTRYVPGLGPVQQQADVQIAHDMLVTVQQRLAKLLAAGMSAQDMQAAMPTKDYDAKWGDPALLIANAWPGLVNRARELGVAIV